MKNFLKTLSIVLLVFICVSCASDDTQDLNVENPPITPEAATIDSYSKNFGYSGETVVITGTNFTTDVNDVEVSFDSVRAEINSVNEQEISLILPETESTIPELKVTIKNRVITNTVENDYNGNIGVLGSALNQWHSMEVNLPGGNISRTQLFGRNKAYFSVNFNSAGGEVYRTINGGLTWKRWSPFTLFGAFHSTSNDEGWSSFGGIIRIPEGGSESLDFIFQNEENSNSHVAATYVDDSMQNGIIVTTDKVVYQTTDGESFTEVYNNSNGDIELRTFFSLDIENIWVGGISSITNKPTMLFLNQNAWKEVEISIPGDYINITNIQFIDESLGFIEIFGPTSGSLLCKTLDGGNTWQPIQTGLEFGSYSFKNEMIGWYANSNEIYKTVDGGSSWSLDHTTDGIIKSISYDDGVVWALSSEKILKYYTE
jgi:hypothetical protein